MPRAALRCITALPVAGLLVGLTGALIGCLSLPPGGPGTPAVAAAPGVARAVSAAEQQGQRWLEGMERLDVLDAYEITSSDSTLGLAVARKRFADEIRLLTYVVYPRHLNEVAVLALRRPGRRADVFTYATGQIYGRAPGGPQVGAVVRSASTARSLLLASAAADAVDLLLPVLPGDYRFEPVGRDSIEDEPCVVLRALPVGPSDEITEIRLWISERTGVALRREYRAGDEPHHTVLAPLEGVRKIDSRWVATVQRVQSANGDEAELALVNSLTGVELPDRLFTRNSLSRQRFPSF